VKQAADVLLYDTTLRDGTQGEGISFSAADKVRIAQELDRIGSHYIEGGYPASNERDRSFFEQLAKTPLHNSKLTSFGMTMRADSKDAQSDPMLRPLVEANTPAVTVVGKTWDLQVEVALQIALERNLEMILQSVEYLKKHTDEVLYDAEHFFDGWKQSPAYAKKTIEAALEGGADWLVLCDTNGGTLPWELEDIVEQVCSSYGDRAKIGVHCHNDTGNGIACSIGGVRGGATMVQGTVGGVGERTGNADWIATVANLQLKMNKNVLPPSSIERLSPLASLVFELTNLPVPKNLPYIGPSAFAHKGGMHTSAVARDSRTYEHIDPETVGNRRRVLISDLSGKASLKLKMAEFGYESPENDQLDQILAKLKDLENDGYEFEGADASLDLLFLQSMGQAHKPFEVEGFTTTNIQQQERNHVSEATIQVRVGERLEHTAALGNGPVNALDIAFRKALAQFFPVVEEVELLDYKVRVLAGRKGTESKVRVLIAMWNGHQRWQTVGVSTDVIDASYKALADSYTWMLTRSEAP
jgi:2-isopropylmalate synthase